MTFDHLASLPTFEEWQHLSMQECEDIARSISTQLPASFRYLRLETYQLGEQKHRVAFFAWSLSSTPHKDVLFAFLPGGEMFLGYDPENPFPPTIVQRTSWQEETLARGIISESLEIFLEKVMSPLRCVTLQPLLFQMIATGNERRPTSPYGFQRNEVLSLLSREGFRLPSSDEWEYACGAGARTLFRWGNETPASRPTHRSQETDTLETWTPHLQPNAFGLLIANDSYQWEFCLEPEIMRGGDGGSATSAGLGTFAEWLCLATSYRRILPDWRIKQGGKGGAFFRRVYDLGHLF